MDGDNRTIPVPAEEYMELLGSHVRIKAFADFVNKQEYSISREDCGSWLGFEVEEKED